MPRQPYLPHFRGLGGYQIGGLSLEGRPEIAKLIGECIAVFSEIDLNMALILSALLKTNTEAAVAVYLVLRRSAAQRETIAEAAKYVGSQQSQDLVSAILAFHKTAEQNRNDLAHGIFGIVPNVQDAVVWTTLRDHAKFLVELYRRRTAKNPSIEPFEKLDRDLFVLTCH